MFLSFIVYLAAYKFIVAYAVSVDYSCDAW